MTWMKNANTEARLSGLFDELVPYYGKAESKAGEIVRAVNRIVYRFYNDGDFVNVGYGKETCNMAARFLKMHGSKGVSQIVEKLWNGNYNKPYEDMLDDLAAEVVRYIDENPELRQQETPDMFDYFMKNLDRDDSEWEDGEE